MNYKVPVYVDCRSLQDPAYRTRGVGSVCLSLLRQIENINEKQFSLFGLLDENLPLIEKEDFNFETIYFNTNVILTEPSIFFEPSPMTHDPLWVSRFLGHSKVFSFTIVYDFIPFERAGYLPTEEAALHYLNNLKWLEFYDHYFPISQFTAKKLQDICGVIKTKITTTKCSIRSSLKHHIENLNRNELNNKQNYFLTVAGDSRKNIETIVIALKQLNSLNEKTTYHLKIIAKYSDEEKNKICNLYGLESDVIEFISFIDDASLANLYHNATATIAASFMEGFSLPIIESKLCDTPVIASNIETHKELISDPEVLFDPYKPNELLEIMLRIINSSDYGPQLLKNQRFLAEDYDEAKVGEKFWKKVIEGYEQKFANNRTKSKSGNRPSVAFLTPFPPDESGIADYSYSTVLASESFLDISVYANSLSIKQDYASFIKGNITWEPIVNNQYDAVISVVGNSHFHTTILEIMEKIGGPCILHDSRLTGIYYERLGHKKFLEAAQKILQREITPDELLDWVNEKIHPSLFLDFIIKKAKPLIVHTKKFKQIILERYGIEAIHIPFASRIKITDEKLNIKHRLKIKDNLGLTGKFVLSSFGTLIPTKNSSDCVLILDQLLNWNIPAILCLVGNSRYIKQDIMELSSKLNITQHIRTFDNHINEQEYLDYLIATDCAIQLRSYDLGQPSGALIDCISAGIPTIATDTLADACDSPSYVLGYKGKISYLLIAEMIADIYETQTFSNRISEERSIYYKQHSFENYAQQLNEALFS